MFTNPMKMRTTASWNCETTARGLHCVSERHCGCGILERSATYRSRRSLIEDSLRGTDAVIQGGHAMRSLLATVQP